MPQNESGQLDPGAGGAPMPPAMSLALEANFGNVDRWREACAALARRPADGVARVELVFRPRDGTLVNRPVTDPARIPDDSVPLVALDLDGDAALAALADIDWVAAHRRYQSAVNAASEPFGVDPDAIAGASVLDVRRAGAFDQARTTLPGARWLDPATVARWSGDLPVGQDLVVYCVHGHEVSRATALRLRAAGLNARFLRGGIDGWQAQGRPLADKPSTRQP